jgi:small-conductance mechanosensitive channel
VESLEKYDINKEEVSNKEEFDMQEVIDNLTNNLSEVKAELNSALEEVVTLKQENTAKDEKIKALEEEDVSVMKDMVKKKKYWEDQTAAKLSTLKEELETSHKEEMVVEDAKLDVLDKVIEEYVVLVGTPVECKERLAEFDKSNKEISETVKAYTDCGSVDSIKELVESTKALEAKVHMENLMKVTGVNEEVLKPLIEAGLADELIVKTIADIEKSKNIYEKYTKKDTVDEKKDVPDTPIREERSLLESLGNTFNPQDK